MVRIIEIILSRRSIQLVTFASSVFLTSSILANPVLNNVSSGNATVQQTQNSTVVNQTSQKVIINWNSFNIGSGESTHFQQPNGGVALNRISGSQGASQIYGRLTATGQIILVNPAGIYFGPSAYVNVGGLIAATANISDQNFLSGNYKFTNATALAGSIINEGTIIAAQNGLVALIGSAVSNKGLIQADLGKVVLASGEAFTMSFAGNDMINFTIDNKSSTRGRDQNGNELSDGVSNTGTIIANGGSVLVTARAASGVLNNVINLEGIVEVKSIGQKNGILILSGDPDGGVVRVAAKVNASGRNAGERGGSIDITGYNILLADNALLDASGDLGGGNINIGGNYQGNGPLPHANAVVMMKNARITADAISSGNGGNIVLWSDYATKAYGSISAQGGALSGNGGMIETSSKGYLDIGGINVNLRAVNGKTGNWLLDPADLTICTACTTTANLSSDIFEPNGTNSNLLVTDLIAQLAGANITVQTTAAGTGGNGDIFVNTDINYNSSNSLTLTAFRNIEMNSGINNSGTGGLNFNSGGTTNINTTSAIQAGGDVAFNNNVVLTQNANISSTAGALNFLGTINGANQLTAAGSSVTFSQAIGNSTALSALDVSGATNINGGTVTTTGTQTYNGAVLLGAATTFNTTNSNVLFNSTLNTTSAQNLTINAGSGDITFNDRIGAINFQPGVTNLNSTGITSFNGSLNYFTSLTTNAGGTTQINGGGLFSASGNITINDDLVVNNAVNNMQSSSGGTITLNAISGDGAGGLQVGAFGGGQIILNGPIAGATPLLVFTTQGPTTINTDTITTSGTQSYVGAITLNNNITMTGSSIVFNNGGLNGAFDLTLTANTVTLGNIGNLTPLNSLTINGSAQSIGSTIAAVGDILVNGNSLNIDSNLTITSSTGSITLPSITATFGKTVGITLNGNTGVTFGNNVGSVSTPLSFLTVNGPTTITGIGGQIRTSGTQTYNGAVTLDQSVDMISSAGSIIFASTLDGPHSLTLNANTGVSLGGIIGGISALNSLNITGATTISGGAITTTGTQTYNSAIQLNNNTLFDAGSGDINFNGTINSQSLSNYNLTANSTGNVAFNNTVGVSQNLGSITTDAGGTTTINTTDIRTFLDQTYNDNITLSSDSTIASTSGGGTLTFNGTVNGSQNLTTSNSATTTFAGAVGNTTALSSFTSLAAGLLNIDGGTFRTSGAQTFNNTVVIGASTIMTGVNLTFNSFLRSKAATNQALTINDSGTTTFNNVVGGVAFSSLTTDAAGSTVINTSGITTTGNLTLNDAVTLGTNTTLTSTTGDVRLANSVNGAGFGLTISNAGASSSISGILSGIGTTLTKSGNGTLTLSNAANSYSGNTIINSGTLSAASIANSGSNSALGSGSSISIAGGGTLSITGGTTSSNRDFSIGTGGGTISNTVAAGTMTLSGNIDNGGNALTVSTGTNTILSGIVSGAGSFTKTGSSNLTLSGANTYSGATTLSSGVTTVTNATGLGSTAAGTTVNSSGILDIQTAIGNEAVTLNTSTPGTATLRSSTTGSLAGNVTLLTNSTIGGTGNLTLSGVIGESGGSYSLSVATTGAGAVTLSNTANTFTGAMSLNGILNVPFLANSGIASSIGAGNTIQFFNSAILNYTGGAVSMDRSISQGINSATLRNSGTGTLTLTNASMNMSSSTFMFDTNTADITVDSLIANTGGINKYGAGTLTLTNNANDFGGAINIYAGTLSVASVSDYGTASAIGRGFLGSPTTTIAGGGTFLYTGGTASMNRTFTIGTSGGTIQNNGSGALTLSGTIDNAGNALSINTNSANITASNVISGAGSLTKLGTNTLTLSGNNTYSGVTNITVGTLSAQNANALGSTASGTIVASGATLEINNANIGNEALTLSGTGAGGAGALLGVGTSSLSGNITLAADTTMGGAGTLTLSGIIGESGGARALTKEDAGTLILAGANTYSGLTIINAGTLQAANASALGATTAGVNVGTGATLEINNVNIGAENVALAGATLASSGTAQINGAISTTGTGNVINANAASTFSVAGNINGPGDLTTQGAGTINISGNIGNTLRLSSLTVGSNTNLSGSIFTTGNQTYNNAIVLTSNRTYDSSSGDIVFNSTIDGAFDFIVSSISNITFAGTVGATALNSLTATANNINLNGGAITTTGNQTYNGSLNLGADTTLSTSGSGSGTIAVNNGVTGNRQLTLAGAASSNDTFILSGSIGVSNLVVNGGAGGNDTLSVNSGSTQNFAINGSNAGQITGITGVAGTAAFSNIENLTGGSAADNFSLSGGGILSGNIDGGAGTNSLSINNGTAATWTINAVNGGSATGLGGFSNIQNLLGGANADNFIIVAGSVNSIDGGAGNNTLTAANGANNTFNINSSNTGSLAGYVGSFSQIQNLTGSTANNTFVFADNASISGIIDGGSASGTNTLDYTAYTSDISVNLGTLLGNIFDGTTLNSLSGTINQFQNISTIDTNTSLTNSITMPNKANTVYVTGSTIGYINDPLYFSGFTNFNAVGANNVVNVTVPASINYTNNTVTISGVTMTFNNFTINGAPVPPAPTPTQTTSNAAQIVQQPTANNGANAPVTSTSEWISTGNIVNQDITELLNQITEDYDTKLNQIKINPYCYAGS